MSILDIPYELKSLPQWVCSRLDSKMPMMSTINKCASSTDPNTWSTFQEAVMSVECGNYDNIGFVFNDNGIVGIDIDDGYDDFGIRTPLASAIIGKCKSYTEKSRSGRGFHILVKGKLPFKGKNNRNGVEIYQSARYFIMTGDTYLYDSLIENQEAIDYILERYFPGTHEKDSDKPYSTDRIYSPKWEKSSDSKIKLRPVYPLIPNGCRNICLTSLAGMLHNQGYSSKQIYDELDYCNKVACDPVLHESEIRTIVRSVTRYKR
jgi:primase-polymerase (primpol)-like protein